MQCLETHKYSEWIIRNIQDNHDFFVDNIINLLVYFVIFDVVKEEQPMQWLEEREILKILSDTFGNV